VTPRRIVSLAPSSTEILCALGVGDRLVGVDKWSDYPAHVQTLPKVGRIEADPEAVMALHPDLVVACTSVPGMERNVERLEAHGLVLAVAEPTDLLGTLRSIRTIGQAIGRAAEADALVAAMEERIARVADVARRAEPISVYWEWWPKPLSAAAGRGWMTGLIDSAGGRNVFADVDASSVRPADQDVIARDPATIFVCWCGAKTPPDVEQIRGRTGWGAMRAITDARVYAMPEGLFARPGPRLVEGLERLASALLS
jgi:iron complex transport system substrate-binding protein